VFRKCSRSAAYNNPQLSSTNYFAPIARHNMSGDYDGPNLGGSGDGDRDRGRALADEDRLRFYYDLDIHNKKILLWPKQLVGNSQRCTAT
jgi:hypothetical protein